MKTTKDKLIKAIQKANPELMELSFGCEITGDWAIPNHNYKIVKVEESEMTGELHLYYFQINDI